MSPAPSSFLVTLLVILKLACFPLAPSYPQASLDLVDGPWIASPLPLPVALAAEHRAVSGRRIGPHQFICLLEIWILSSGTEDGK